MERINGAVIPFAGSATAAWGLTAYTGGGEAHPNVQPTMVLNYIIRT